MLKILSVLLLPWLSYANDLSDSIKVKKLYIETEKRVMVNRSYYLNDQQSGKYDLNLGLDLDIKNKLYYHNKIVSMIDSTQFRFVGLEFEIGTDIIKGLDLYFQHFSGHAMDDQYPINFPQDNKIGIRWNLIKKP